MLDLNNGYIFGNFRLKYPANLLETEPESDIKSRISGGDRIQPGPDSAGTGFRRKSNRFLVVTLLLLLLTVIYFHSL